MPELKGNQRYFIEGRGEADDEEKQWLDRYRDGYMDASADKPETLEKTEAEKELVEWVMQEVARVPVEAGAKPYPYQPEHFHLVKDEFAVGLWREAGQENPRMWANRGGIFSPERSLRNDHILETVVDIAHECFHLFGLNKFQFQSVGEEGDRLRMGRFYRSGVRVIHKPSNKERQKQVLRSVRFAGLNEALTQCLARLFYSRVIRNSERFREMVAEFDREHPAEEPAKWRFPEGVKRTYGWLVNLFYDLCDQIQERQPEKFKDFSAVRNQFLKIYFTGEIKDLKPLLDIVGPGSFGDLAEIGATDNLEDFEKISKFRAKYGLPVDEELERVIGLKKEEAAREKIWQGAKRKAESAEKINK